MSSPETTQEKDMSFNDLIESIKKKNCKDFYVGLAAEYYKIPESEVSLHQRSIMKAFAFPFIYSQSKGKGLQITLHPERLRTNREIELLIMKYALEVHSTVCSPELNSWIQKNIYNTETND